MSTAPPLPGFLLDALRNDRHIGAVTIDALKGKWQAYYDLMEPELREQPEPEMAISFLALGYCSGFVTGIVHASLHGLE